VPTACIRALKEVAMPIRSRRDALAAFAATALVPAWPLGARADASAVRS